MKPTDEDVDVGAIGVTLVLRTQGRVCRAVSCPTCHQDAQVEAGRAAP